MAEYRPLSEAYRSELELAIARPISAPQDSPERKYSGAHSLARFGGAFERGISLATRAGYDSREGNYSSAAYKVAQVSGIPYVPSSKSKQPLASSTADLMGKNVYA